MRNVARVAGALALVAGRGAWAQDTLSNAWVLPLRVEQRTVDLLPATDAVRIDGETLRRSGAQSFGEALVGKIPGMRAFLGSASFGALPAIQLRGFTSYSSTATPLVLVDGLPLGVLLWRGEQNAREGTVSAVRLVSDFPLSDVDHVTVLRGAAASAMYGPTAYNGVILIATRAPTVGKATISIVQRVGISRRSESLPTRRFAREEARVPEMWDSCGGFCDHEDEFFGGTRVTTGTSVSARAGTRTTQGTATFDHRRAALPLRDDDGSYLAGRLALTQYLGNRVTMRAQQLLARTRAELPFGEGSAFDGPTGSYVFLTPSWYDTRGVPSDLGPSFPNPRSLHDRIEAPWLLAQSATSVSLDARLLSRPRSLLSFHAAGGVHRMAQRDSTNVPRETDGIWQGRHSDSKDEVATGRLEHSWRSSRFNLQSQVGYQRQSRDYSQLLGARRSGGLSRSETLDPLPVTLHGLWANSDLRFDGDRAIVSLGVRRDRSTRDDLSPALSWRTAIAAPVPRADRHRATMRAALGQTVRLTLPGEWPLGLPGFSATERRREGELGLSIQVADGRLRLEANAFQSRASNVPLGTGRLGPDGLAIPILPGGIRTRGFDASATLASVGSLTWDWNTTLRVGRSRSTFVAQKGGLSEGAVLSSQWGRFVTFRDGLSVTALVRGDASPTFVFAQSNDVSRRRWRLTTQIDGEVGGRISNYSQAARDDLGLSDVPDGGAARSAEANDGALIYLQGASWIRLRELTLSHVLSYRERWLLPANTRFELGARDLVTWSRLDAYDPAARPPLPPRAWASSQSMARFPMMRTIEVRIVMPR